MSLYEETKCEHGRGVGLPHCPAGHDHGGAVECDVWCPGGSRREVTVDYEAAEALFDDGNDLAWLNSDRLAVDVLVRKIVVAAVGVEKETL